MKKEAQRQPVNRCFGDNCSPDPKKREELLKELLKNAAERRREESYIDSLLRQFHGRYDPVDLLPLVARSRPPVGLAAIFERIKKEWKGSPPGKKKRRKALEAIKELGAAEYVLCDPRKQQLVADFMEEISRLASELAS